MWRLAQSVACSLALCCVSTLLVTAQTAAPADTASVSGTVVDSLTKQPLRAVEVHARNLTPGQQNSKPHIGSSTTDADGRFTIDGLPPGRYFLFASQEGYVGQRMTGGAAKGRALNIGPDQHLNDLTIELIPGATISGLIKNSDGKPVPGVSVELVRHFHGVGGKQLSGVTAPSFTDSAGKYRITDVGQGQYYLLAVPPTTSPSGEVVAKDTKDANEKAAKATKDALAPIYYPNSREVGTAAPITVRPGSDLAGMDITLTPVHALTVEGKVLLAGTSTPAANAQLTLISDAAVTFQREVTADAKGAFQLRGVPSGDYTLVARIEAINQHDKMFWGQRPLHVNEDNLRGADLRIWWGAEVNGRIHIDEKANIDLTHINATLWPQGNSAVTALMPSVTGVTLRADGSFEFNDVPEGIHRLEFTPLPPGYFLKSSGAADALETGLTISNGQPPPPVDLTLSPNAAQVTGTVAGDQMPAAGAFVVLVPQGARKGLEGFSKRATADQAGRFTMKGVTPGDYKILAFETADRILLSDPEFVQRFEDRGETLHLGEGDAVTVSLDAIPADEASP